MFRFCVLPVLVFFMGLFLEAYETDQYSNRGHALRDSRSVLNRKVNETIGEIARDWRHGEDESRFVMAVYWRLGGLHWVDKIERWAMQSAEVDRIDTPRHESIYQGIPPYAARLAFVFGVGKTIKVNGCLIGTDKFGHFFSQGRKFYMRYLRFGSVERAARRSAATERGIFGEFFTGTYSNADLVANFEGYRFYRSLFHDDVTEGKGPILRWQDGKPIVLRRFDWADHVNVFWDEALNPNHYDRLLYPHMRKKIQCFCEFYTQHPKLFPFPEVGELEQRYDHLQFRDAHSLRLDCLCEAEPDDQRIASKTAHGRRTSPERVTPQVAEK